MSVTMSGSKEYFDFLHKLENDAEFCYGYLQSNLNKNHPTYKKCLETISKNAKVSLSTAENIIEGRFELAEPEISKQHYYAVMYARSILKGRFELGEEAISKSPESSFDYARHVLRGRFELGENAIAQNENLAYRYATEIILGQLPEHMHNIMMAKRISA